MGDGKSFAKPSFVPVQAKQGWAPRPDSKPFLMERQLVVGRVLRLESREVVGTTLSKKGGQSRALVFGRAQGACRLRGGGGEVGW